MEVTLALGKVVLISGQPAQTAGRSTGFHFALRKIDQDGYDVPLALAKLNVDKPLVSGRVVNIQTQQVIFM